MAKQQGLRFAQPKLHHSPGGAGVAGAEVSVAPEELFRIGLHRKPEASLEWSVGRGDVVTPVTIGLLDAQAVECMHARLRCTDLP